MKSKLLILLFLVIFLSFTILLFMTNIHFKKRTFCGNGICEIHENSVNCCMDCGCYKDNEICIENKCVVKEIELSDDEFVRIVEEYFKAKGETIEEVGEIYNISLKTILGKTAIIKTNKDVYGVTIAENRTLFLYECCMPGSRLIEVWIKP